MTVGELIRELQHYGEDMPVVIEVAGLPLMGTLYGALPGSTYEDGDGMVVIAADAP